MPLRAAIVSKETFSANRAARTLAPREDSISALV